MGTRNADLRFAPLPAPVLSALALIIFWTAGCGAPGEPQPRRPPVPVAITDLAARQSGEGVALTFTLPKRTIEGNDLGEPPMIEVYRGYTSPEAMRKAAARRLVLTIPSAVVGNYFVEGHIELVDTIPAEELASHPGQPVVYIVTTRAAKKRASADSNAAVLRMFPVPPQITDARAVVTEIAIELSWSPPAESPAGVAITGYRVYRAEVDPTSAADAAKDASKARPKAPLALLGTVPGGSFRDTQFEFGKTYLYLIRSLAVAESATIESGDSNPVVVEARDIFPPAAPQGLVAVVVPATSEAPGHIELSWGISPETDWAGYYVYRSDKEGTVGERLTPRLLLAPTFRDISVVAGRRYFYQVTAVDKAGNESSPSAITAIDLPQPPR